MTQTSSQSATTSRVRTAEVARARVIDAGGLSARGSARERNEDQFLIASLRPSLGIQLTTVPALTPWIGVSDELVTVLAVADGMAGEGAGAVASAAALEALALALRVQWPRVEPRLMEVSRRPPAGSLPEVRAGLARAFETGNAKIQDIASREAHASHMGTTLSVAWVGSPFTYVAHIGDSRCYIARNGKLERMTRDHTAAAEVPPAVARTLADDSPLHHVLSRALGGGAQTNHVPDIIRISVLPGDVLLLASDGVTNAVDDPTLASLLARPGPAQTLATTIVQVAKNNGATDDTTAVVARVAA